MIKRNLNAIVWFISSALLCCGAGCTDTGQWSIGTKIGTLGVSGELTKTAATDTRVGILSGRSDINGAAPYIGIGWGNLIGRSKKWGFHSDFGVAFADSPDVVLRANGTLAADPRFQADLAREAKDITEDLEDFEVYPVISVGLCFLF